ncbi:hypothetical protein HDR67_00420 [bacterium]|nr:hypothetical protein [bacterium]
MKRKFLSFLRSFGIMVATMGIFLLLAYLSFLMNSALPMFIFFGCIALLSVLMIPIILKRMHKEVQRQENMTEEEIKEEINADRSKLKYDAYQVKAVADNWRMSSTADKIKGILFLVFFLGCIIGFMVLMSSGHIMYGLICFGVGAGTIVLALIVVKLLERRSLHLKEGRDYTKAKATVLSCTMSSQSTTGTRRKYISNTTYKVQLRISSNRTGVAYSKESYEIGDRVIINIDTKNPNVIHIIKKQEDIFDLEEEF